MTGTGRQPDVDTPARCHYADDPAHRPDCTLTATVRYGTVLLCASCQARRSTLGKGHAPTPITGPELDVLDWLAQAHRQAAAAETTLTAAIARARQQGHPWTTIGAQLGITRQAAQQRFARANHPAPHARIPS